MVLITGSFRIHYTVNYCRLTVPFFIAVGLLCNLCVEHDHLHVGLVPQVLTHGLPSEPPLLQLILLKVVVATGRQALRSEENKYVILHVFITQQKRGGGSHTTLTGDCRVNCQHFTHETPCTHALTHTHAHTHAHTRTHTPNTYIHT